MPRRKLRMPVVLDTNVLVSALLNPSLRSANARVVWLWRAERKLQLVVSAEIIEEYVTTLRLVSISEAVIGSLVRRLDRREIVTHVRLGPRMGLSRDPDDNVMLATAQAGFAKFLVTQDRDLLDIPASERRSLKFEIVTPAEFLVAVAVGNK